MYKKIISVILTASLALTLTACGEDEKSFSKESSSSEKTSSQSTENSETSQAPSGSNSSEEPQTSEPVSQNKLQIVLFGGGRADIYVENAVIEKGSGGDVSVEFETPSGTYSVGLSDFGGSDLQCSLWKQRADNPDASDRVGNCPYKYEGTTLKFTFDLADFDVHANLFDVYEYTLAYNPKGKGYSPETFRASDVVIDKREPSSASSASSSSSETSSEPPSAQISSMDFSGIYALESDQSEPYFFLLRWEQGYTFKFFKSYHWYSGRIIFEEYSKYYEWASNVFGNDGGFDTLGVNFDGTFDPAMQESMMDHELSFNSDGTITLTVGHNGQSKTGTFVKTADIPTET